MIKQPPDRSIRTLFHQRVDEIHNEDMKSLLQFAERSVAGKDVPYDLGSDLFHRAIAQVMTGERQPRLQDVQSKENFHNYIRGAIRSVIDAYYRRHRNRIVVFTEEPYATVADLAESPAKVAEMSDVKAQLFKLLRQRAPAFLQPTIDAWEKVFPEDIPALNGQRRYRFELKRIAAEVLRELGWER